MKLDKSLLHYFVRDALGPYSENFAIRDKQNPTKIQLNGNTYSIHVSYIHDSGNNRSNVDEVRIQISRKLIENQKQCYEQSQHVAFIGFFEGGKTFVAWDPRHVFSLNTETMVSLYGRQSQQDNVEKYSASVYEFNALRLKERSFAIALPSSTLGFYLENIEHFHRIKSEDIIQSMIRNNPKVFSDNFRGISGDFEVVQEEERKRFTYTRTAFPRNPQFKKDVMAAYKSTCCICNRQLAIVQAAHIIPHSESDSPNTVTNGLALCIEHHRLYDDALLLPGPDRKLVFNEERAEYLRQTKQERGLDDIAAKHDTEFIVPDLPKHHPSNDYLQRGLDIRLGQRSCEPDAKG